MKTDFIFTTSQNTECTLYNNNFDSRSDYYRQLSDQRGNEEQNASLYGSPADNIIYKLLLQ